MRRITRNLLLPILLAACATAAAAQQNPALTVASGALDRAAHENAVTMQRGCKSLNQAVEEVRRRYQGRIVSAETKVQNGQEVHEIKVLTSDGKVKTERIPGCRRN